MHNCCIYVYKIYYQRVTNYPNHFLNLFTNLFLFFIYRVCSCSHKREREGSIARPIFISRDLAIQKFIIFPNPTMLELAVLAITKACPMIEVHTHTHLSLYLHTHTPSLQINNIMNYFLSSGKRRGTSRKNTVFSKNPKKLYKGQFNQLKSVRALPLSNSLEAIGSIFIEPFDSLSIFPDTDSNIIIGKNVSASTMLLSIGPLSIVSSAISPSVDTMTMFLVMKIFTFILSAIFPGVSTLSMHIIIQPFSFIFSTINPSVYTKSWNLVLNPVSNIFRAISPHVSTISMLLSSLIIAFISGPICPGFYTISILQVILPLAFILSTINMNINTVAIGLIISPLTFKNVTINMPEFSLSMSLIVLPFTFVFSTIRPDLHSPTVSHASFPFSFIDSTTLKGVWGSLFSLCISIIITLSYFSGIFWVEVAGSSLWSISISNIGIPDIGSSLNGMSSATLSFDRSTISYGIVPLLHADLIGVVLATACRAFGTHCWWNSQQKLIW